jgi:hypothetical protein
MSPFLVWIPLGYFLTVFVGLQVLCVRSCLSIFRLTAQHDALRKSKQVPEQWKPFIRPPGNSLPPLYLALFRALTIGPILFMLIILSVLAASTFATCVTKPSALRIASSCGRACSWFAGVRKVTFKGIPASPAQAPLVVVNHISWLDFIVVGSTTQFAFVMSEAVSKAPIVGPGFVKLARHVDSIMLERSNAQSREAAKLRIREKLQAMQAVGHGERLVVFSEGTLTNGEYVVPFKLGAFEAMTPVQPLRLHFSNPHYSLADIGTVEGTALFVCLGGTDMTLEWGEVVKPGPDDTPETLAMRARSALVKGSRNMKEASEGSYRDHLALGKERRRN